MKQEPFWVTGVLPVKGAGVALSLLFLLATIFVSCGLATKDNSAAASASSGSSGIDTNSSGIDTNSSGIDPGGSGIDTGGDGAAIIPRFLQPRLEELCSAGVGLSPAQAVGKTRLVRQIFTALKAQDSPQLVCKYITPSGGTSDQSGSSWDLAIAGNQVGIEQAINTIQDASAGKVYLILFTTGNYLLSFPLSMKNHLAIVGGGLQSGDQTQFNGAKKTIIFENNFKDSTATLANLVIKNGRPKFQSGPQEGGGMYNNNSSPTLIGVTFSDNQAEDFGGGMYNLKSSPTLVGVTFSDNKAGNRGGGMYNLESSPTLIGVTFSGNKAGNRGGGMYNSSAATTLIGVTFFANNADRGGGIFNDNNSGDAVTIASSILWGNTAYSSGKQIYLHTDDKGAEKLTIGYSILQGGIDGIGYNTKNPGERQLSSAGILLQEPKLSVMNDNGGLVRTLAIGTGSPAIDAGLFVKRDSSAFFYSADSANWYDGPVFGADVVGSAATTANPTAAAIATDSRGYGFSGLGNRPDMGAFEFNGIAP